MSSDHFLTVSEGSSSSFNGGDGNEPDSEETWIQWFCNKKGNEFICEVDTAFIMDEFNLQDLKDKFSHY